VFFHTIKIMVLFGLILAPLFTSSRDVLVLNQLEFAASSHMFGLVEWEIVNLSNKWIHKTTNLFSWDRPTYQERAAKFDQYFQLSHEIESIRRKIILIDNSNTTEDLNNTLYFEHELATLIDQQSAMRLAAEEYLEEELTSTLRHEKIISKFGFVFPPANFRFQTPPKLLVTSPRNKIARLQDILLKQNMSIDEMEIIEIHALSEQNLAAVIIDIGGIATYPAIIPAKGSKRHIIEIAAHEWLHHYLFFKDLGKHFGDSNEMTSLNETIANIVGQELSRIICTNLVKLNQECEFLNESRSITINNMDIFNFSKEMKETRLRVEELLIEQRIVEAENYMEQRRKLFQQHGIFIRKLNQAYFAFHGTYADTPASISPIGQQVKELRSLTDDLSDFLKIVSDISSYEDFIDILDDLRLKNSYEKR